MAAIPPPPPPPQRDFPEKPYAGSTATETDEPSETNGGKSKRRKTKTRKTKRRKTRRHRKRSIR